MLSLLFNNSEITDINDIESDKEYVERYQLVPVNVPPFNQQTYEQQATRVRSSSDSPESTDLAIRNNATVYVTTQHPSSVASGSSSGLRYASAPEVQYESYDYQQQHHQTVHSNAHGNGNNDENIKIELIRNQHPIHGKVYNTNIVQCLISM